MVPPFYLYEGDALDFSWMRELCPGFGELRRQAYNERLGEVAMTDLLKTAPQRAHRCRLKPSRLRPARAETAASARLPRTAKP